MVMKRFLPLAMCLLLTLLGGAALGGGSRVLAQDATPAADDGSPARPGHIHAGRCGDELGDVVAPLTDLTAPVGDAVGQQNRAALAETSFTNVPLPLDAILADRHAINLHLSADEIGTYIACGNIGGVLDANGALVIGLGEESNSGYTGIAFLSPGADGASTDVSVFIAEVAGGGRGGGGASDDAVADDDAASDDDAAAEDEAAAEDDGAAASDTVAVSLSEFTIDMPTSLPAGQTVFEITNTGEFPHNFEIEGEGIEQELAENLRAGDSGVLVLDLAPGTYTIYCPVGNHREQGMELELTVT